MITVIIVRPEMGMIGDRQFANEVVDLFYDEWDPIGLGEEGRGINEYGAYIGSFAGLVSFSRGNLTVDAVERFFIEAEEHILVDADPRRVQRAADRAMEIIRAYERRSGALLFQPS